MFKIFGSRLKKEKNLPDELRPLFEEIKVIQTESFSILRAEIQDLKNEILHMESKLQRKDLIDRQRYGELHYKIHEIPPKKN